MRLEQVLQEYAKVSGGVALLLILAIASALSQHAQFRRDLRRAQMYLVAFIAAVALERLLPDSLTRAHAALNVLGLVLFVFGAIRGALAGWNFFYQRRTGLDSPRILRDILNGVLYVVAAIVVLRATTGVDLGSLLTASAVLSLVLGLALQETLGNLFAGLSLQLERPFAEGDVVRIGAFQGRVMEVTFRSTRILTGAGEVVTLPNNVVAKDAIANLSRRGSVQRKFNVSVAGDRAPNDVKDAVLALLRAHPRIVAEPASAVRLVELGPAIAYEVSFWVARFDEAAAVEDDVRTQLWYRLRRADLPVPFPTSEVRLVQDGPAPAASRVDVPTLLGKVDFLAHVKPDVLGWLGENARVARFGRGEAVIVQGDPVATPFYVIADGEVVVRTTGGDGLTHELARLSAGQFFGEMAVFTGEPRTATVVAAKDTTLVSLSREAFAGIFERSPEAAKPLAEVLARRREALALTAAGTAAAPSAPPESAHQLLDRLRGIFKHVPGVK